MERKDKDPNLHPLQRRLNRIEWLVSQRSDLDPVSDMYVNEFLLPSIQPLEGFMGDERISRGEMTARRLATDIVLYTLGGFKAEVNERKGRSPLIHISEAEMDRLRRASQHLPGQSRIQVSNQTLPDISGTISLGLDMSAGGVSLSARLSPNKLDQQELDKVQRAVKFDPGTVKAMDIFQLASRKWNELYPNDPKNPLEIKNRYYSEKGSIAQIVQAALEYKMRMNEFIGNLPFSDSFGFVQHTAELISAYYETFAESPPDGLLDYDISLIGELGQDKGLGVEISSKKGNSVYQFYLDRNKVGVHMENSLVIKKTKGKVADTAPQSDFEQSIEEDQRVIEAVLDWVYKVSEVDASHHSIEVAVKIDELSESLFQTGLVHQLRGEDVGLSFSELGGHYELKRRGRAYARAVIRHKEGEIGFPGHALLHGETGTGKSTMARAIASDLVEAGIPVYELQATELTSKQLAENPDILNSLFLLGGVTNAVILLPDLDITLGVGRKYQVEIEAQLNGLLETTAGKRQPVLTIADTAHREYMRDSLIQAHRLGANTILVGIEQDPQQISLLLERIIINKTDQNNLNLDKIKERIGTGELNLTDVVDHLIDQGNILTPSRLDAIVNELLITEGPQGMSTNLLKERITNAVMSELKLRQDREAYDEEPWRQMEERIRADLEERITTMSGQMGTVLGDIKKIEAEVDYLKRVTEANDRSINDVLLRLNHAVQSLHRITEGIESLTKDKSGDGD